MWHIQRPEQSQNWLQVWGKEAQTPDILRLWKNNQPNLWAGCFKLWYQFLFGETNVFNMKAERWRDR